MQRRGPAQLMEGTRTEVASVDLHPGDTESWVLFTVDDQIYALDLVEVERMVRAVAVTPLPEVPAYVAGVVDVQGRVLPVVDLRLRFDRPTRRISREELPTSSSNSPASATQSLRAGS